MANGKKDNLDVKDRQILLGVATGLSFDNKIFTERLQQEIERLGRNGVSEQSITCLDRSGQIDTYDGWVARGLPSSGWSLCRDYCYCQLIPADIETDDKIQL